VYIYITPRFRDKQELYSLHRPIERLIEDSQKADETFVKTNLFQTLRSSYLRKDHRRYRFIGSIQQVEQEKILCLLEIFDHDRDYRQFSDRLRDTGKTDLEDLLDPEELKKAIEAQKASNLPSFRWRVPPDMQPWLELPAWGIDANDLVIYESEEWVTRFRKPKIKDYWQTYYQLIGDIAQNSDIGESLPGWPQVRMYGESQSIVYSQILTTDTPPRHILFLIAPFENLPAEADILQLGRKNKFYESASDNLFSGEVPIEKLTVFAQRSYPDYLLADDKCWLEIEREEEANLALSAEEMLLLESVSSLTTDRSSLPIFINGRAGSGKSTMLLYLFSDYCHRKYYNSQQTELSGDPLFLTYNERLLEVAKKGVQKLLVSHHRFQSERTTDDPIPDVSSFFKPFQKFLIELLPLEYQREFSAENYISFFRFKKLYENNCRLPQAKKWNAEICWHVIRSFIKGYRLEGEISPSDYQTTEIVNRRDRTIEISDYQEIYETIWERWYKSTAQEHQYWDDQDLIRKVLELDSYESDYAAIFCDEAQDFTRIELQLIMKLWKLSQYDLQRMPIFSLPFAFAGDPLQTLNPTGFRWSTVKAAFHEAILNELELEIDLNLKELEFNYRSSPPIVRFTNLIQFWRSIIFNLPDLKPQKEWRKVDFPDPQKFILDRQISLQQFKEYVKDTIIIVPCEEGEENEFVQNDEILSQIFVDIGEGEPVKNILSAIAAKGLEFKKVILYKFGEACNPQIWNQDTVSDCPIEFEYFFNKLYVAASRAMERLFIIDSEVGDAQLWRYASSQSELDRFSSHSSNRELWKNAIQLLSSGGVTTITDISEDNPLLIAQEFETKGLNSQNPRLLKRAKQYYSSVGESQKADWCEALALQFEERFREAGRAFVNQCEYERAWDCFWEGMCWDDLLDLSDRHDYYKDRLAVNLAEFMVDRARTDRTLLKFNEFLEKCIVQKHIGSPFLPQWKTAIAEFKSRIAKIDPGSFTREQWLKLGSTFSELDRWGYSSMLRAAGEAFFKAQDYHKAEDCLANGNATEIPQYYLSQAEINPFPEKIEWLAKAGAIDRIVRAWEEAGKPTKMQPASLKAVASALEKEKQYTCALRLYIELDELEKVKECFAQSQTEGDEKLEILGALVTYLIERNQWIEAIAEIDREFSTIAGSETQKLRLKCDIVRAIAYSDLTSIDMNVENRQRYEQFMEQILSQNDWEFHLSMQQIGSALERIGGLVATLKFYERFIGDLATDLKEFARQRWIVTKRKQADYFANQGQVYRADDIRYDLENRLREWGINPTIKFPFYPSLPKYNNDRDDRVQVDGLSADIDLQRLDNGNIKFNVGDLEIKTLGTAENRLFAIEDQTTFDNFKFHLQKRQRSGDAKVREKHPSRQDRWGLEVIDSGYEVEIDFTQERPTIELTLKAIDAKILLSF